MCSTNSKWFTLRWFKDRYSTWDIFISVHTGCVTHPASQSMGTGVFSTWVKRQRREAEHFTATSAEIMNTCYIYTQHAFTVYIRLTKPTLEMNSGLRGDKLAGSRPQYSTVKLEKLV
jgi:hypothetical protein